MGSLVSFKAPEKGREVAPMVEEDDEGIDPITFADAVMERANELQARLVDDEGQEPNCLMRRSILHCLDAVMEPINESADSLGEALEELDEGEELDEEHTIVGFSLIGRCSSANEMIDHLGHILETWEGHSGDTNTDAN